MKIRLDKLLTLRNLAPTQQKAQALIGAGLVVVNGHRVDKAGTMVDDECELHLKGDNCPYVSRGGLKLAAGLDGFNLDPSNMICADIGASTGGFTDCLLQRGAAKVYAIDVGYGQLAWKLRQDPRVVVMERTNARKLTPNDLADNLDLVVIDASFISLQLLLPPLLPLFAKSAAIVALIKPQFEVSKGKVGKGGVVRDSSLHEEVIESTKEFAQANGLVTVDVVPSPVLGPKGNREFLIYLVSKSEAASNPSTE